MSQNTIILIKEILMQLRPAIEADGGDIEFVSFDNGIVSLLLKGACATCPLSFYTLKLGIEERLKEATSEVKEVRAV